MFFYRIFQLTLISFLLPMSAFAGNIQCSADFVHEIQNEHTASSDDKSVDGYSNLFFRTEIAPNVRFNDNLFIDGVMVFEGIQDRDAGESNFLDNEGVFVEELKINYEQGGFGVVVGKFNPAFGQVWDFGRGIWGEDFAEDYEVTEKLGLGLSYEHDLANAGTYVLSASSFFADTSFLSGSLGTRRDPLKEKDGGASNTEDLSSFVFSLDATGMTALPGFAYSVAYRYLGVGDADTSADAEQGLALTLGQEFDVSDRVHMDALAEFVSIDDFETQREDRQYVTASLVTTFDDVWNVAVSYTARDVEAGDASEVNDYLLQISGGYDFGQGTTAEIGWRASEEGSADSDIIGGLIRHSWAF